MGSYLSQAVRAVWSGLKTGPNVSAHMAAHHGHYYDEDATSKKPLRITKSDCPAIIMAPAVSALTIAPATNVSFDVRLPLNFDLRVEDEAVYEIVDFYELVLRDLHAAWRSGNFGLAAPVGLYTVEPGQAQIHKLYDETENSAVFVSWQIEFLYTLVFRRQIER